MNQFVSMRIELAGRVVGKDLLGHHHSHMGTAGRFYIGYTNPYENITHRLKISLRIRYKAHYNIQGRRKGGGGG